MRSLKPIVLIKEDNIDELQISGQVGLQDQSQRGKSIVRKKLIYSLILTLDLLMECIMNKSVGAQTICKITQKRQKDKIKDSLLNSLNIYEAKEEYSSLLYFTLKNQLHRFPAAISTKIQTNINKYYFNMIQKDKSNIINFYLYIKNIINIQINQLININVITQVQYKNQIFIDNVLDQQKIVEINQNFGEMYEILKIEEFNQENCLFLRGECENSYFLMLENQFKRNQIILTRIVKISKEMKKNQDFKRFRLFTQNNAMNKIAACQSTKNNFKIKIKPKKSTSCFKNTENLQPPPKNVQTLKTNKQIFNMQKTLTKKACVRPLLKLRNIKL